MYSVTNHLVLFMVSSVYIARENNGLQKGIAAPMTSYEEISQGFEVCKVKNLVDIVANVLYL